MPINFIKIDINSGGDTTHARDLRSLVDLLSRADDLANRIYERMNQMQDGVDYSTLETNYRLPTGFGDDVFSAVDQARTALGAAVMQALMNRLG